MVQGIEFNALQSLQEEVVKLLCKQDGFILLSGGPGSGKTSFKDRLVRQLRSQLLIVDLSYSRYSFNELIQALSAQLKLDYPEDNPEAGLKALCQFSQAKARSGIPLTLIVDDAQFMPLETLTALKDALRAPGPQRLFIRGILIADHSLAPKLQHNFLEAPFIQCSLTMPRLTEDDLRRFIRTLITEQGNLAIEAEAEQLLLMNAAGNLRQAKQLLQQAFAQCRQTNAATITETLIENLVDTASAQVPTLDSPLAESDSGVPEDLRGILTHSLLDTPDKPVLKQKRAHQDAPLFVNDLAASEVKAITPPPAPVTSPAEPAFTAAVQSPPLRPSARVTPRETDTAEQSATQGQTHSTPGADKSVAAPARDAVDESTHIEPISRPAVPVEALQTEEPRMAPTQSNPTPAPAKANRKVGYWVAAIFIFMITLGWLTTQPGFNPAAKMAQIKTLGSSLLNQITGTDVQPAAVTGNDSTLPPTSVIEEQKPATEPPVASKTHELSQTSLIAEPESNQAAIVEASNQEPLPPQPPATEDSPTEEETQQTEMDSLLKEVEDRLEQEDQIEPTNQATTLSAHAPANPLSVAEIPPAKSSSITAPADSAPAVSLQTPSTTGPTALEQDALEAQLRVLKKKSQIQLDAYRYTIPENDNAVLSLRRLLALNPTDSWAQEQLQQIRDRYLERAHRAENAGNSIVAAQNYARLLWMEPNNNLAQKALKSISAAKKSN